MNAILPADRPDWFVKFNLHPRKKSKRDLPPLQPGGQTSGTLLNLVTRRAQLSNQDRDKLEKTIAMHYYLTGNFL